MSSASTNSGVIPLQRAIDHYFELALYLLVLTGFGTLAGTGGLDLPSSHPGSDCPGRSWLLAGQKTSLRDL